MSTGAIEVALIDGEAVILATPDKALVAASLVRAAVGAQLPTSPITVLKNSDGQPKTIVLHGRDGDVTYEVTDYDWRQDCYAVTRLP